MPDRRTRPAKPSPPLVAGVIAWAHTWPDWERIPGQESPHPILIIGRNDAGEVAVLPMSSKPDLGRIQVPIGRHGSFACASAYKPTGPLDADPSWICISDKLGRPNLRWATPGENALVLPKGSIRLRKVTTLATGDWQGLQRRLSAAIRQSEGDRE